MSSKIFDQPSPTLSKAFGNFSGPDDAIFDRFEAAEASIGAAMDNMGQSAAPIADKSAPAVKAVAPVQGHWSNG